MRIDEARRRNRRWRGGVLPAATLIALLSGGGAAPAKEAEGLAPFPAGATGTTGDDDPCRFATAEAIGQAFGRSMKSSKLANICEYRAGTDLVVVKVTAGPEGTILRHLKTATAQNAKGAEKVATKMGEAYFDSILPVFVGRVGNQEVQLETTIQPTPRDAMIAAGTRIMETLARK